MNTYKPYTRLFILSSYPLILLSLLFLNLKMYRTWTIESWYEYQKFIPSHLHSIKHYEEWCKERAKLCTEGVMVLMDKVVEITGYTMVTGWSPQNNASTNGYIDVRTGKHYPYHESIFVDIA